MEGSVFKQVEKYASKKRGAIILPDDFRNLGSDSGVRTALMRLTKEGKLERISQGVYFSPQTDHVVGKIYPSIDDIANKIAKRDRVSILPTGISALNRLGLSTQVPMKHVYLTDGSSRVIAIGKSSVRLKHAAPRNFAYKGQISSLVILALRELGAKNINDEILNRVGELLKKEDPNLLKHDIATAPRWIADKINDLMRRKTLQE